VNRLNNKGELHVSSFYSSAEKKDVVEHPLHRAGAIVDDILGIEEGFRKKTVRPSRDQLAELRRIIPDVLASGPIGDHPGDIAEKDEVLKLSLGLLAQHGTAEDIAFAASHQDLFPYDASDDDSLDFYTAIFDQDPGQLPKDISLSIAVEVAEASDYNYKGFEALVGHLDDVVLGSTAESRVIDILSSKTMLASYLGRVAENGSVMAEKILDKMPANVEFEGEQWLRSGDWKRRSGRARSKRVA